MIFDTGVNEASDDMPGADVETDSPRQTVDAEKNPELANGLYSIGDDDADGAAATTEGNSETPATQTANSGYIPEVLPPSREDIELLRNSSYYTPAQVNAFIDLQRPIWLRAGVGNGQIDQYYGVSRFDKRPLVDTIISATLAALKEAIDAKRD